MGSISRLYKSGIYPNQPNDATQVALELDNIIENGINDNYTRTVTNATNVNSLTSRMSTAETSIADHEGRLDLLESGVTGYVEVTTPSYTITAGSPNDVCVSLGLAYITLDDPSTFNNGERFFIHPYQGLVNRFSIYVYGGTHKWNGACVRNNETVIATVVDMAGTKAWSIRCIWEGIPSSPYDFLQSVDGSAVLLGLDDHPTAMPQVFMDNDYTGSPGTAMGLSLPPLNDIRRGEAYFIRLRPQSTGANTNTIQVKHAPIDGSAVICSKSRSISGDSIFNVTVFKNDSDAWDYKWLSGDYG